MQVETGWMSFSFPLSVQIYVALYLILLENTAGGECCPYLCDMSVSMRHKKGCPKNLVNICIVIEHYDKLHLLLLSVKTVD